MRQRLSAPCTFRQPLGRGSRARLSIAGKRRCIITMSRASSSLRAARAKRSAYSSMEFALLPELLAHLCEGFPWFISSGLGDQAIVEVFPQCAILLEIDEHSGFLVLIIHHKLNTFHLLAILLQCSESDRVGAISSLLCPYT